MEYFCQFGLEVFDMGDIYNGNNHLQYFCIYREENRFKVLICLGVAKIGIISHNPKTSDSCTIDTATKTLVHCIRPANYALLAENENPTNASLICK